MKAFQITCVTKLIIWCLAWPTLGHAVPSQNLGVEPNAILKNKIYVGGKSGDGFALHSVGQSQGVNTEDWIFKFTDTVGRPLMSQPPYFQALHKERGIQFDIFQIEASLIDQNLLDELVGQSTLIKSAQILIDSSDNSVRLFIQPRKSARFSIREGSSDSSILLKIVGEKL